MRLGTTIRPWRREEFDLDIVCQLQYFDGKLRYTCTTWSPGG